MEHALDHLELTVDACGTQPFRVRDVLVVEQIESAHTDPRRRDTGQVVVPRGRGERRHGLTAGFLTEVRRPARTIGVVVPEAEAVLDDVVAQNRPVVEHRIDEGLDHRRHLTPFEAEERELRSQASAGAGTGDRDAGGVDVVAGGEPDECVVTVVERGRERVLRGESIVHGDDHGAELGSEPTTDLVVLEGRSAEEPAAVDPDDARHRAVAANVGRRHVHASRHLTDRFHSQIVAAPNSVEQPNDAVGRAEKARMPPHVAREDPRDAPELWGDRDVGHEATLPIRPREARTVSRMLYWGPGVIRRERQMTEPPHGKDRAWAAVTDEDEQITVYDDTDQHRYVVTIDGDERGMAVYHRRGERWIFVHTETDSAFGGRGLGSRLAQGALDDVAGQGGKVVPLCPFIAGFIDRHRQYEHLVDTEMLELLDND